MDLGFAGRRALLLASSRGLGFGVARALAREGCEVFLTGRDEAQLGRAAAAIAEETGRRVLGRPCDLYEPGEVDAAVAEAEEAFGGIDILLLNSGGPPMGGALEHDEAVWRRYFGSMVLAQMRATRRLVPGMVERGWGRVLAVTSSGVPQPIPAMALSNTLRAALTNWLKTLAGEVAPHGVTVNCLIPGRVATDRVAQLDADAARRLGTTAERAHETAVAAIPARRDGRVEEFAAAALFLASEQGGYVTGSAIRIDGGMIRNTMA